MNSGMGGIIDNAFDPRVTGAVGAAVNFTFLTFHAVTENAASATLASGREAASGALERIKVISRAVHRDFE